MFLTSINREYITVWKWYFCVDNEWFYEMGNRSSFYSISRSRSWQYFIIYSSDS